MTQTQRESRKLDHLSGFALRARDGELGRLKEVYFDDVRWTVRYFVVHTGSWLLGRDVLIMPAVVTGIDLEAEVLEVELEGSQVKNAPPVNADLPVSRQYEQDLYLYYGWDPYWLGDPLLAPATFPAAAEAGEEPVITEDTHLRSSKEVKGYGVQTRNGPIGHVEDFLIQGLTWQIGFLEVDTRDWLPGKHVLVPPQWVERLDWTRREVRVGLERETLETAPPYDPDQGVSETYRKALNEHYDAGPHDAR